MDERERRRQRRYREAMRNRAIAAVFLAVLIVGTFPQIVELIPRLMGLP